MPRPKEFDPTAVLKQAMNLFWEKGYAATSVQDLVERMGINRFSLYSTFGGKHDLYLAALEQYCKGTAAELERSLKSSRDGISAIRSYFTSLAQGYASDPDRRGCMIANSASELSAKDGDTALRVRSALLKNEEVFHGVLQQVVAQGKFASRLSPRELASFLAGAQLGLAVLAKARPESKDLNAYVKGVVAALD